MRAIILAAGLGSRLENHVGQIPKVMIRIGNQTLLERHLNILHYLGINEIIIAVGYKFEFIAQEIRKLGLKNIELVQNVNYTDGSIVTLNTLESVINRGGSILIMDGDVLYDHRILEKLIRSPHENCFLLDRDIEPGEEPMKLAIHNGNPVDFRKTISGNYDYYGESVGFFKFNEAMSKRISKTTSDMIFSGLSQCYMEEAIRKELKKSPQSFSFEDISGIPWIEIDFPKDIQKAQNIILPQLISIDHSRILKGGKEPAKK